MPSTTDSRRLDDDLFRERGANPPPVLLRVRSRHRRALGLLPSGAPSLAEFTLVVKELYRASRQWCRDTVITSTPDIVRRKIAGQRNSHDQPLTVIAVDDGTTAFAEGMAELVPEVRKAATMVIVTGADRPVRADDRIEATLLANVRPIDWAWTVKPRMSDPDEGSRHLDLAARDIICYPPHGEPPMTMDRAIYGRYFGGIERVGLDHDQLDALIAGGFLKRSDRHNKGPRADEVATLIGMYPKLRAIGYLCGGHGDIGRMSLDGVQLAAGERLTVAEIDTILAFRFADRRGVEDANEFTMADDGTRFRAWWD